jgi:anti-anti-sigma factor
MSASQAHEPRDGAVLRPIHASRSARRNRQLNLQVRTVEGTTVVDVLNAETLFAEDDISDLGDQLHGLVEAGHTQLILNFDAVRTMSSDVLGLLAGLHRRLERSRGRLGLTGLDPVVRDMLRICRLDCVFDIHQGEPEASCEAARRNVARL